MHVAVVAVVAALGYGAPPVRSPHLVGRAGTFVHRPARQLSRMAVDQLPVALSALDPGALVFADQGQNLAGIFFQASLVPYLAFLFFLSRPRTGCPPVVLFGFQFLLLFVLSTIPGGIIAKSVFGTSLANVDWLHGAAEALLTVTNLVIVAGLQAANAGDLRQNNAVRAAALAAFASVAAVGAVGISGLGLDVHSPFLAGAGNLPETVLAGSPIALRPEPDNALSLPTWAIHTSSVIEWVFAMAAMWDWGEKSGNARWRGFVWAMLPLHASGIAACTYHFFFNSPDVKYLVDVQAGLTLVGNTALAIAAARVAFSEGWTPSLPFSRDDSASTPEPASTAVVAPAVVYPSPAAQAAKILVPTVVGAYGIKYASLALPFSFEPSTPLSLALLCTPPALLAATYAQRSLATSEGAPRFSMEDVKTFGVAGTIAYVLTELAFWAVAFPVAATVFYRAAGHWPDLAANADRAAVVGFIFAGANAARLAVPLRLGAALWLAPWVDDNIVSRLTKTGDEA